MQGNEGGHTRIYDFSTILDRQETMTPTKGIIVTRALDLGEPDVLKTITDRITREVPSIVRVCMDLTPKPCGTIEWE